MNIRDLIDNLDSIEHTTGNPVNGTASLEIKPVEVDNTDHSDVSVMIPPQAEEPCAPCDDQACACNASPDYEEEDETHIDDLVRLAGMPGIIVIQAQ